MRCRRQKLNAYASPAVSGFAQIDNPAFLLFLGLRVNQHQHFAVVDFVAQIQQAAVSADHQGLTDFAKLAAFMAATEGLQAHLMEDTLAAALRAFGNLSHAPIFALPQKGVNCPFGQVFPGQTPSVGSQ